MSGRSLGVIMTPHRHLVARMLTYSLFVRKGEQISEKQLLFPFQMRFLVHIMSLRTQKKLTVYSEEFVC